MDKDFILNCIHFCDQVIVNRNNNNSTIVNIFDTINARNFPALRPMLTIFCNVAGKERGSYRIEVRIKDCDGSEAIGVATGPLEIKLDGGEANFIANFLNVIFKKGGKYPVEIKIDSKTLDNKEYFLIVKEGM